MKRVLIAVAILELILATVFVWHQRASGPQPAEETALYATRAAADELASRVATALREVAAGRESLIEDQMVVPNAAGELTGAVAAVPDALLIALEPWREDGVQVTVALRVSATVGDTTVTAGRCAMYQVRPGADVFPGHGVCPDWGPKGTPLHLLP